MTPGVLQVPGQPVQQGLQRLGQEAEVAEEAEMEAGVEAVALLQVRSFLGGIASSCPFSM